jgi:hypothetical protein
MAAFVGSVELVLDSVILILVLDVFLVNKLDLAHLLVG